MNPAVNEFPSALSFCFDNLFDRFGNPERIVIDCLASARQPISSAEIHYLCPNLTSVEAEVALSSLHNSSIVSRIKSTGEGLEYLLSESAQKFLSIKSPPSSDFFKGIQQRMRELRQVLTLEAIKEGRYEYDPYFVRTGVSKDEKICATYLRRALDKLNKRDFSSAREAVSEAKRLTPGSSEAWRIGALIEDNEGELYSAVENYEQAIGLDPNSAIARYCYGLFLMNDMENFDSALAQFEAGERIDPDASPISTAKALALTRLGRFEEAVKIHEILLPANKTRVRRWRLSGADQAADCFCRFAFRQFELKEYSSAKEHYKRSLTILLDSAKNADLDNKLFERAVKVSSAALSKRELTSDDIFSEYIVAILEQMFGLRENASTLINVDVSPILKHAILNENFCKRIMALDRINTNRDLILQSSSLSKEGNTTDTQLEAMQGSVHHLLDTYGFIVDTEGKRWFFQVGFMKDHNRWKLLQVGDNVTFRIGQNARGLCAIDVQPM